VSRERVERVLDLYRLFNEGKFDEALQELPDDIDWVVLDVLPDQGPYRGREGVRRFWATWQETFDDFRIEILATHDLDHQVVVTMRVGGTGRDSGIGVDSPAFPAVWTWRDDDIVRMEMFSSEDDLRAAIGKDWR
jgi:ketosteroid isomerase-like protein